MFYLASKSPRRQELLRQLGYTFEVIGSNVDETPRTGERPHDYAVRMASEKARAARPAHALPVLGADTDVVLDGRILGKPAGRADALAMLAALSGRTHEVCSSVALLRGTQIVTALSVTQVTFGTITQEDAEAYWASGEPADKAGAYGIQGLGAQFVREIRGSYSGVVGLPLYETHGLLTSLGIRPNRPHPSPPPLTHPAKEQHLRGDPGEAGEGAERKKP